MSIIPSALYGRQWTDSHPGHCTPNKKAPGTTEKRLGGPQSYSECFGEEENFFPLLGWSQFKALKIYVSI